ncbi:MAG: alpha/beta hydrolase [Chloroflexota bacterium]
MVTHSATQQIDTSPTTTQDLTIVALHGNGGGAFRFARVQPFVPETVGFHALTLPGFANKPRDRSLQTLRDYATHLRSDIAALPRPIVLLGHGIGGSIALEFIQHHAEDIDALILHAPVGTRLDSRLFPKVMAFPGMRTLGQQVLSSPLTRPVWKRLFFSQQVPVDFSNRFFAEYRQCTVFSQMFDLITPKWFQSLRPIDIPSALLWGERERVLKVDHVCDYQALLPNHTVRIVPNWDHFPMIEEPEAYAQEIAQLALELVRP